MDLKVKDVAELFRVSEKTIRRWLREGKIPAYRLKTQYRFSRIEIENWVMSRRFDHSPVLSEKQIFPPIQEEKSKQYSGLQQFSLYRAIHQGGVYLDIPGKNKKEIIRNAMKKLAGKLFLDAEVLTDLLLDREALMPTALNHGVAVPHTRDFALPGPFDVIAVVFPEEPIEYGALDNEKVHTLFFLFARKDKSHLHLLAKLAHLSSNKEALEFLKSKPPAQKLLDFIKTWETNLKAAF